jgi:pilus assembly protein CpaC
MSSNLREAMRRGGLVLLTLAALSGAAHAAETEKIRIAVGRAEVVTSNDEVKTVAIADPKIADAAVGSARTVVVNGKSTGTTTLVVYNEGGRFRVYDVEVHVPNSERQVKLRVTIAEINTNAKKELGFDLLGEMSGTMPWLDGILQGGFYTAKPVTPTIPLSIGQETDGFLGYVRNDSKVALQTTWRALEEKGYIRTLANPTLVARSGEKATFLSGGEFPVPTAGSENIEGTSGTVAVVTSTVRIQWKEFGIKVDFTPTVMPDERISLKVAPEVSALDFSSALRLGGFVIPVVLSRKASTTVDIHNGEYLVIGGLKQQEKVRVVKRVPVLGHIPLVGYFFSDSRVETVDKELVVVVSPELVASTTTMPPLPTDRPERK